MKIALDMPFNQSDERLTTLHELVLLSSVSTIICSNEVSLLLKADVHLADIANCTSPSVCECKWMCLCVHASVHMCILETHSRQKSQRKPEVIQSDFRPSVSARRNDRGSSDKLFLCLWSSGQHSSISTSICDPCLPFSFFQIQCLPLHAHFILFQMYQLLTHVHLWLCCVAVFQMSPQGLHKQQMGRTGSVSFLSSITKIMWWCDTQGTTKGKTDLISFPYKVPPLFWLCKSGKKNRCWSNLMWSLWRIRDGNSLWWLHPKARPTLVSHCQTSLHTAIALCASAGETTGRTHHQWWK